MSKKDKTAETALPENEAQVTEDPVVEPEPEAEPESESEAEAEAEPIIDVAKVERKGSGGVAWLALFLALITLASLAYMQIQDWRVQSDADQSASSLADLRSRIVTSSESLSNLDRGLSELAAADAQAASELEQLQSELDQRIQLLD